MEKGSELMAAARVNGPGQPLLVWAQRHPDGLALALVVGVALFCRAQVVFRAPMFMQHDSLGYILPAWELATGEGFGVGFRRTPAYRHGVLIAGSTAIVLIAAAWMVERISGAKVMPF